MLVPQIQSIATTKLAVNLVYNLPEKAWFPGLVCTLQDRFLSLIKNARIKNPLEKEMATHSSMLAWEIPWTEISLVGYSPRGHTESDLTQQLNNKDYVYEKFIL